MYTKEDYETHLDETCLKYKPAGAVYQVKAAVSRRRTKVKNVCLKRMWMVENGEQTLPGTGSELSRQ